MTALFDKVTFIGMGLIGGSLALDAKKRAIAHHITAYDNNAQARAFIKECGMTHHVAHNIEEAVRDADLIVLATPVGVMPLVATEMASHLKKNALITDTGSCKKIILDKVLPLMPSHVSFIPAHPVAGTEHSGPQSAERNLFDKRWCILTPPHDAKKEHVKKIKKFWQKFGMKIAVMEAGRHDKILALTSHLPHLIAFSIVGTATDLEQELHDEVTRYSAGGFRDFTRIAASDAIMWRDIFLDNKEFVLEALEHFHIQLEHLTDAVKKDDKKKLQELIARNRKVRHAIIKAGQE